jgi:hypothetical protein
LTPPSGSPIANCIGFGTCTYGGGGRIAVTLEMFAALTCPNQAVFSH